MESRGRFPSHDRPRSVSPVKQDYALVMIRNDSGAKIIVPSVDGSRRYTFEVGQVMSIDKRDAENLLSYKSGAGCVGCGGSGSAPLFSIVEG